MTNKGERQHGRPNWVVSSPIWLLLLSYSHNPILFDISSFVNIISSTNSLYRYNAGDDDLKRVFRQYSI